MVAVLAAWERGGQEMNLSCRCARAVFGKALSVMIIPPFPCLVITILKLESLKRPQRSPSSAPSLDKGDSEKSSVLSKSPSESAIACGPDPMADLLALGLVRPWGQSRTHSAVIPFSSGMLR